MLSPQVQAALSRGSRGRTVLIIAHRLSTVEKADRVLVIHKGRVVEEGTPSDLLTLGGLFTSLAQHQLLRTGRSPPSAHHALLVGGGAGEADDKGDDGGFAEEENKLCSGGLELDSGMDFSFSLESTS